MSPELRCPYCGAVFATSDARSTHDDAPHAPPDDAIENRAPDLLSGSNFLPADSAFAHAITGGEEEVHTHNLLSSESSSSVETLALPGEPNTGPPPFDPQSPASLWSRESAPRAQTPSQSWTHDWISSSRIPSLGATTATSQPAAREAPSLAEMIRSWSLLGVVTYASFMTLLLCWLGFSGRIRWGRPVAPAAVDHHQANTELSFEPPARLAPLRSDRLTTLGSPLRVGQLEITPLEVYVDGVWLRHSVADAEPSYRKGGADSLWLKVRIRNLGNHREIAPLEAELVRPSVRGDHDALIELPNGLIPMFPLAVNSEWAIEGQDFPALGPGEAREFLIASAPRAAARLADEMTWRIRLRIEPNRFDTIGISFRNAEVGN